MADDAILLLVLAIVPVNVQYPKLYIPTAVTHTCDLQHECYLRRRSRLQHGSVQQLHHHQNTMGRQGQHTLLCRLGSTDAGDDDNHLFRRSGYCSLTQSTPSRLHIMAYQQTRPVLERVQRNSRYANPRATTFCKGSESATCAPASDFFLSRPPAAATAELIS